MGGGGNATEMEGIKAAYDALDKLGDDLLNLTKDIAESATSGSEVHIEGISKPGAKDIDPSTSAGLFAVTQGVSINERQQTVVAVMPKKNMDITSNAAKKFEATAR